jgi:cytochrome bd-type quinol oxidase subunit 1
VAGEQLLNERKNVLYIAGYSHTEETSRYRRVVVCMWSAMGMNMTEGSLFFTLASAIREMEFHKEIKEHELELASILISLPSGVLVLKVVFVDQRMDRMPQTLRRPCEGVYNMASVRSMSRGSSWGSVLTKWKVSL